MNYYRELPISSLHVLECSFHVGYKWLMVNVSTTRDNCEGMFMCVLE